MCIFLASPTGTIYIGVTSDLEGRLSEHKQGLIEGFTKKYHVKKLVYYEHYQDIRYAIEREKELKGWRRSKKVELIEEDNPQFKDLSADWE